MSGISNKSNFFNIDKTYLLNNKKLEHKEAIQKDVELVNAQEFTPTKVEHSALDILASQNVAFFITNKITDIHTPTATSSAAETTHSATETTGTANETTETTNDEIDIDALFGDRDYVDAKYLTDNFNDWENSSNDNLKEMYQIIKPKISELGIDFYEKFSGYENKFDAYDRELFFNTLIKMINDEVGVENTNPITLTKEAVTRLYQNNLSDTLNNIFSKKSDPESELTDFEKEYYTGSIDGEISDFGQGFHSNSCGWLAGIIAINSSEKGKEIIKNSIKTETDPETGEKFYRVRLNQSDWSDPIYITDIINIKNDSNYDYACGDIDVLILEYAMDKLGLNSNLYNYENYIEIQGLPPTFIQNSYDDFKNGNMFLICGFPDKITVQDINNNDVEFFDGHYYAITDMYIDETDPSKSTITIVNPYQSDVPIVLYWNQYCNTNANVECNIDKNNINIEHYIDNILTEYQNGDKNKAHYMLSTALPMYNDKQQEYIVEKLINVYVSDGDINTLNDITNHYIKDFGIKPQNIVNGVINIISQSKNDSIIYNIVEWILREINGVENIEINTASTDWSNRTQTKNYTFDFEGQHYKVSQTYSLDTNEGESVIFNANDIQKYTNNKDIISRYFEVSASVDGEPLIYRIKDDVTFEDFINVLNINLPGFDGLDIDSLNLENIFDMLIKGQVSEENALNALYVLFDISASAGAYTGGRRGIYFDYNGKHYSVSWYNSVADGTRTDNLTVYNETDLLRYTNNLSILYKYFNSVSRIYDIGDSENAITSYQLKDGVTFEEFMEELKQNNIVQTMDYTSGPYIHVSPDEIENVISGFKNGGGYHGDLYTLKNYIANQNGVDFSQVDIFDIEYTPVILEENPDGTVNFELKLNVIYKINND